MFPTGAVGTGDFGHVASEWRAQLSAVIPNLPIYNALLLQTSVRGRLSRTRLPQCRSPAVKRKWTIQSPEALMPAMFTSMIEAAKILASAYR